MLTDVILDKLNNLSSRELGILGREDHAAIMREILKQGILSDVKVNTCVKCRTLYEDGDKGNVLTDVGAKVLMDKVANEWWHGIDNDLFGHPYKWIYSKNPHIFSAIVDEHLLDELMYKWNDAEATAAVTGMVKYKNLAVHFNISMPQVLVGTSFVEDLPEHVHVDLKLCQKKDTIRSDQFTSKEIAERRSYYRDYYEIGTDNLEYARSGNNCGYLSYKDIVERTLNRQVMFMILDKLANQNINLIVPKVNSMTLATILEKNNLREPMLKHLENMGDIVVNGKPLKEIITTLIDKELASVIKRLKNNEVD